MVIHVGDQKEYYFKKLSMAYCTSTLCSYTVIHLGNIVRKIGKPVLYLLIGDIFYLE